MLIVWYHRTLRGIKITGSWSSEGRLPERILTGKMVKISPGRLSSKTGGFVKEEPRGQERQKKRKYIQGQ